jgi:hypothetical protein
MRGWKFVEGVEYGWGEGEGEEGYMEHGEGMTREYGREKFMHKLRQNNLYSLDGIEPLECILMWGGGGCFL